MCANSTALAKERKEKASVFEKNPGPFGRWLPPHWQTPTGWSRNSSGLEVGVQVLHLLWDTHMVGVLQMVNWISPNTSALNLCLNFFTIHCSVPGEKHRVQRWCIQSEDSSERRAAGCTNMGALLTPGELPGIGRRQLVPMVWLQIVCSCSFSRWHSWRSNVLRFWKGQWKSTE